MKSTNDNPTPTTLDEILESCFLKPAYWRYDDYIKAHKQATQSIKEQLKALLPEKITIGFNKYHHQTQVEGYNKAIQEIEKAIEEWAK